MCSFLDNKSCKIVLLKSNAIRGPLKLGVMSMNVITETFSVQFQLFNRIQTKQGNRAEGPPGPALLKGGGGGGGPAADPKPPSPVDAP